MIVHTEYSNIPLPGSPMRTFVAAPKAEGEYPASGAIPTSFSSHRRCSASAFASPGTDSSPQPRKFIAASNRLEQ
jgi:hypothetical protein